MTSVARVAVLERIAKYAREDRASALTFEPREQIERVVVATHLPPWSSAAWHDGRLSNQDWCTYFVSVAVGRVIEGAARARPDVKFAVLCGHTHGVGVVDLLPNLRCTTGAAEYGSPRVAATFDFGEPDARGLFA